MELQVLDERRDIITVPGVLTPAECADLIALTEGVGFAPAPISAGSGFVMVPEVRNNTRVMLDDPARASDLWQRLGPAVARGCTGGREGERDGWRATGLNERFRFYRYEVGQTFRWHYDGSFMRSLRERSRLTVMVYLNGGFGGGDTEFADGPVVEPRAGMALLFAHPVLHQGAAVTRGVKYVMRTDVMYTRPR